MEKEKSMRVFFVTSYPAHGPKGGPGRVVYRLLLANREYKLIQNAYGIFSDSVYMPYDALGNNYSPPQKHIALLNVKRSLKRCIPKQLLSKRWRERVYRDTESMVERYRNLCGQYAFSESDLFIIHDHLAAFAFLKAFPGLPILSVYHQQGSLYNEYLYTSGIESQEHRQYLDDIQRYVLKESRFIGFPSKGAASALQETAPDVINDEQRERALVFYNGVECPFVADNEDCQIFESLQHTANKWKFVTVATLNVEKGVERVPRFLGTLKKHSISFVWVVVGDGPEADVLKDEIAKNNIRYDVIWVKNYISHENILRLFSLTDFYIIFHRHSIFDLATLEAMGYGNIPILSPIGGNLEMIIDKNGIFVDDATDTEEFEKLLTGNIKDLSQKNIELQREMFSDYACLKRYADFVNEYSKFSEVR